MQRPVPLALKKLRRRQVLGQIGPWLDLVGLSGYPHYNLFYILNG